MRKINLKEIDWKEAQEFYNQNKTLIEVSKEFKISTKTINRASSEGFFIKRDYKLKVSNEVKKKISIGIKKYLKENPEKHPWKNHEKFKSVPCEKFKKILIENKISFLPEYSPIKDRFYSVDVAFPDKKIAIEINGNQHYNADGSLKPYYQEKHDTIKNAGWEIFEIHYGLVYDSFFVNQIIKKLKSDFQLGNIDYSKFEIKKKKKKNKYGTAEDYNRERKIKNRIERENSVYKIKCSNINFSKLGWVNKVAKLLEIKSQKVKRWMNAYMPEFYEIECYKRKKPGKKKVKLKRDEYLKKIKEESFKNNNKKISMILKSNIDFNQRGWSIKLSLLLGVNKTSSIKWIKKYIPELYEKAKRPQYTY